jgi:Tfp pilus assembly protein PilX
MHKIKLFGLLKNQSGQALLIIVLVLVVALTVGLSIASRSITNLRTTQDQASSQKALSAAEAGAEQAIISQNKASINGSLSGNTTYTTSIASVSGAAAFFVHGNNSQTNKITKGSPAYIWTTTYSASQPFNDPWGGTLTIYWGDSNGPSCPNANVPALEITVISGATKATAVLQRFAYDPCSGNGRNNGFAVGNANNPPQANFPSLKYYAVIGPIASIYLVSVTPLYADTRIGVASVNSNPNHTLPYQGADIVSTGIDSQVQRKVYVFQGFPQIPAAFFPYTIFSP